MNANQTYRRLVVGLHLLKASYVVSPSVSSPAAATTRR